MEKFSVKVQFVLAVDSNGGIGWRGKLPWPRLETDIQYFKNLTVGGTKNVVIMGRKTYESIPRKYRPLKDRLNMVLTRNVVEFRKNNDDEAIEVFSSIGDCLAYIQEKECFENIYVVGGSQIYSIFLKEYEDCVERIYITRLKKSFECDTFFPFDLIKEGFVLDHDYKSTKFEEKGIEGVIEFWWNRNINNEEYQYLDLCKEIMEKGSFKMDRTTTGTFSKFGVTMRFDLSKGRIPLFTTKRVFHRGIIEELLWFLRGDTNAKNLSAKNVHIWDGNGSRKFLDQCGFTEREEGDLGPVYGFQWRHFNAPYRNHKTDYKGKGIDQINTCIEMIRKSPNSRRIIFTAWNPCQIKEMALPPCHLFCQFFVVEGKFLNALMYQRSGDMGLGVPFNVASYSILTVMIAQICGLIPGEFIHVLGDAHVYKNHIEALKKQIMRVPRKFPILEVNKDVKSVDDFKYEDFKIIGYKPHKTIKMEMAL